MCNIIDGKCELAEQCPDSLYHNNPSLYYQVDGEVIEFQSALRRLSPEDPKYGYKIHAIRTRTTKRIIAIYEKMAQEEYPGEWWGKLQK